MSMASGVEVRVPFLDSELINVANNVIIQTNGPKWQMDTKTGDERRPSKFYN